MSADGNDTPLETTGNEVMKAASAVCAMIAEGKSLKDACSAEGMPPRSTFYHWLSSHRDVLDMYTRAREERADLLADQVLDIADAPLDIPDGDEDGDDAAAKVKFRKALEQRRQMIDARKWAAAKLNPKVYSDRTNLDHSGSVKLTHEKALSELE